MSEKKGRIELGWCGEMPDPHKPDRPIGDAHGETIGTTPPSYQEQVIAVRDGWLAECYRLTGADPDGNEDWRLAPGAVQEVARLRKEFDGSQAALALAQQERDNARQVMWTCGCGWINGVNLATCAMCTRVPDDNAVSYSADIENLRKPQDAAEQALSLAQQELQTTKALLAQEIGFAKERTIRADIAEQKLDEWRKHLGVMTSSGWMTPEATKQLFDETHRTSMAPLKHKIEAAEQAHAALASLLEVTTPEEVLASVKQWVTVAEQAQHAFNVAVVQKEQAREAHAALVAALGTVICQDCGDALTSEQKVTGDCVQCADVRAALTRSKEPR